VNGTVDEFGRALVTLTIRASQDAEPTIIQAWIDTAFNGELVMPIEGEYPLLGIGLLIGHRLVVDYTQLTITIE